MTFEQWCVMVYEKSCGKYPKGKKHVFESGYYTNMNDVKSNCLRVVAIHDHPIRRNVSK